jgi:hypothetical protein
MKLRKSLLFAFSTLLAVSSVQATTVIAPNFDELVQNAEVIFEGTVTDVQSQWAGEGGQRHIVSYVTFQVADSLKGSAGANYTMRMLGGTVGDETMAISDAPQFKVGDRDILFVEKNGTQFIPLVGIMHGRFRVQQDGKSNAAIVLDHEGHPVGDLARLGKDEHGNRTISDHSVAARTDVAAMSATAFKSAVQAKLAELAR